MTEWGDTLQAARMPGSPPDFPASKQNHPKPSNYTPNDLTDPRVIDDINNHLERAVDDRFLTPYIALERMRKTLNPYGIFIPSVTWLNGDEGDKIFAASQFTGFGELTSNPEYNIYMSWSYDPEKKAYDIYAALVNNSQLDSLLSTDNDGTPFDDQDVEEDEMSEETSNKKPTEKEKREAGIAKLLAYAPHLTREQAIKQIGYDKELDKKAKEKYKTHRGVFGIK